MVQQQQQTKLKPIQPTKIGGMAKMKGKLMTKMDKKLTKSKPSMSKVQNSVRKTMGY